MRAEVLKVLIPKSKTFSRIKMGLIFKQEVKQVGLCTGIRIASEREQTSRDCHNTPHISSIIISEIVGGRALTQTRSNVPFD